MKKLSISIVSVVVITAFMLSACSGVSALLPNQSTPLLNKPGDQIIEIAAQATAIPTQAPVPVIINAGPLAAYESTLENIYVQVNPSVVNIRVVQSVSNSGGQGLPFFNLPGSPDSPQQPGNSGQQYTQGFGSGFVWDKEGHIVTNNHVVDGADKVEVTFADGTTVPARVIGTDPYSDLAVVKVDVPADRLQPVQLADSTQVKVGQIAIAIGNPYGRLEGTMTVGIVSALGRSLPASEGMQSGSAYSIPDLIQTDAPINPGNSGGVLVDDQGQLIGVTFAIESSSGANAGIGFAIPSAIVQRVVPSLIKTGNYEHTYLGITGTSLSPNLATAMNLKADTRGVLVEDVSPGSPAEKAGLRGSSSTVTIDGQDIQIGGDVIVAIDGQSVKDMEGLISYLTSNTAVGQKVALTILRDGKEKTLEATLAARPAQSNQTQPATATQGTAYLGISAVTMAPEIAQAMNLSADQQGVLIERVASGSPAEKAGLKGGNTPLQTNGQEILVGGDVILAVDNQAITTGDELLSLLQQYTPGDTVVLTILRDGGTIQVKVTLGERPS